MTGIFDAGAEVLGRPFPATEGRSDTFVALVDPDGEPRWIATVGSAAADGGGEIESDEQGTAWLSTSLAGATRVAIDGEPIDDLPPPGGARSAALLLRIGADGALLSHIAPDASGASAGQTLGVRPDGGMVATSMAFGETIGYGPDVFTARVRAKNFLLGAFSTG